MKKLESWLDSHRTEGQLVEEGDFTISAEEALRKVAQFGLESPEKGLLRLAQLSITGGCRDLDLSMGRSSVTLHLSNISREVADLEQLSDQLRLESNNFGLALLACLHSGFRVGHLVKDELVWKFDQDGFHRSRLKEPESSGITIELQREKPSGFWNRLRHLLRRRCLDYKYLRENLNHSPRPVKLDGSLLDGDSRPRRKLLYELFLEGPEQMSAQSIARPSERDCRYLYEKRARKNSGWAWQTYERSSQKADLKHFDGPKSKWKRGKDSVLLAHLWIPALVHGISEIHFVSDGVVIGTAQANLKLPLCGVVSASGLDRDLSCLELVHNEKLTELLEYLTEAVEKRLRDLCRAKNPKHIKSLLRAGGYLDKKRKQRREKRKKDSHVMAQILTAQAEKAVEQVNYKDARKRFNVKRRSLRGKGRY